MGGWTREYVEHEVEYGSRYVGSPDTVAPRVRDQLSRSHLP